MVKEIIETKNLSIPEVKEILTKVYERLERIDTPPDPFAEATYEYVHNFSKMDGKIARDIIRNIVGITRFQFSEKLNALIIRGNPGKIAAAERLISSFAAHSFWLIMGLSRIILRTSSSLFVIKNSKHEPRDSQRRTIHKFWRS